MNYELIDKLLGYKIDILKLYEKESRIKVYKLSNLKTVKEKDHIDIMSVDPSKIWLTLHGTLRLEIKHSENSGWETFQQIGAGIIIPCSHLKMMEKKYF